MTNDIQV